MTTVGTGTSEVRTVPEEVERENYLHGVSIVEVRRAADGRWSYVQDSPFNRRIHALTNLALSGPAAGTSFMVTRYSPTGMRTRGTLHSCGYGYTPWGTYLATEENWNGSFRRIASIDDPRRSAKELTSLRRYGISGVSRELWATVSPDTPDGRYGRWNAEALGATPADDFRNAPNTFGWIVEIDPYAPAAAAPDLVAKKRTALGRFAHEGAWPAAVVAGKPLVFYMGCDSKNEYIYKYVSAQTWDPADANRGLAAGDKYLEEGTLYVAKVNATGTGQWLPLRFGSGPLTPTNGRYSFANQADVLINARLAADAVGGTRMDRPEWGAVDPITGVVYMTLTNSDANSRTLASTDAANPRHYNDVRDGTSDQFGNPNGHIIRWLETGHEPAATTFAWDIFVFGARAGADAGNVNLSGLTADNDFSSPDGLWFSSRGVCWIATDDDAYSDVTNCILLAALPGEVGDGGPRTVRNIDSSGASRQVGTFVGAPPGTRLRRFLTGPRGCEITGLTETPDGETLFVNIQHPGANWPGGWPSRPRSATLAITRNGGGAIGL